MQQRHEGMTVACIARLSSQRVLDESASGNALAREHQCNRALKRCRTDRARVAAHRNDVDVGPFGERGKVGLEGVCNQSHAGAGANGLDQQSRRRLIDLVHQEEVLLCPWQRRSVCDASIDGIGRRDRATQCLERIGVCMLMTDENDHVVFDIGMTSS